MRIRYFVFILIFIASSCKDQIGKSKFIDAIKIATSKNSRFQKIHVIPLGNVNPRYVNTVSRALFEFYGSETIIENPQPLQKKLLSGSKKRYSADSILAYLDIGEPRVFITNEDIVYWDKDKKCEWGILGLGKLNGNISVVSCSPKRMGKGISQEKLVSRLRKVSIHEVGHNLGIEHCTFAKTCIMHAADGKASNIDNENEAMCSNCKKFLSDNKIF